MRKCVGTESPQKAQHPRREGSKHLTCEVKITTASPVAHHNVRASGNLIADGNQSFVFTARQSAGRP